MRQIRVFVSGACLLQSFEFGLIWQLGLYVVILSKISDKKDRRAEALRKHVKKAEMGYRDGIEVKAARMFEWLKDQTDKDEAN